MLVRIMTANLAIDCHLYVIVLLLEYYLITAHYEHTSNENNRGLEHDGIADSSVDLCDDSFNFRL